jgi:hypothetical protein
MAGFDEHERGGANRVHAMRFHGRQHKGRGHLLRFDRVCVGFCASVRQRTVRRHATRHSPDDHGGTPGSLQRNAGETMTDDSTQNQILVQEQWAIEVLARETQTEIGKVQTLFVAEFSRLSAVARIQSFVPLLTARIVREILEAQNASTAAVAKSPTQP